MNAAPRPLARLAGWVLLVVALVAGLTACGHGVLAAPDLDHPATWATWLAGRDAVTASLSIFRLAALAFAWYLAVTTAVGIVARALRAGRLVAVSDVFTVPAVRRLLQGALGVGLAATSIGGFFPTPAMAATGASPAAVTTTTSVAPGSGDTATMRFLTGLPADDPGAGVVTTTTTPTPTTPAPAPATTSPTPPTPTRPAPSTSATPSVLPTPVATPAPTDPAGDDTDATWTVRPGDSFWRIAAEALERHTGRPPSDREVVPYWHALIDANRGSLVDKANPDLIFPGQHFTLPPVMS